MKKFGVIFLSFLFFLSFVNGQTVVVGGGGPITCPALPTATWTTVPVGVSFSNWTRGAGVSCVSAGGCIAGSGFNTANAAASIAANAYYSVTITADATHTFTLNQVFWDTQVSGAGGCNFNVYYSNNNGPLIAYGTTGTSTVSNTFTGTVTVAPGTSIVVYLVPSGTTAAGTTVRWNNGSSFDLTVTSTLTEYPIRVPSLPWQTINNPCDGVFTDAGGSGGNYANSVKDTITFCAPAGQYLYFNFTAFNTESGLDVLKVYNGPTPASPQIGSYSGTALPGTIVSALGGCITFVFSSDASIVNPGWAANITCSTTPPPPNDLCANAQPVLTDGTCVNGTTVNATDSWSGNPGCQTGAGNHPDVWYSFVATGTQAQFSVNTSGTFSGNTEIILVSGTCGGTFTTVGSQCGASPLSATFSGLTIGTTYYYTISSTPTGTTGNFQACLTTITPPPPANNEPCAATALPPVTTSCTFTNGTTVSSTITTGAPAPSCVVNIRNDVWFTVTVPPSGIVNITTQSGTMTDGVMAVYTGTCNSLTEIACNDNGTGMPQVSLTGLTPGSTLWIRVWGYSATGEGSFGICATIPSPPAPEQDCPSAIPICSNSYTQTVSYTGTGAISNEINPANSCLANGERADVWYTFTVQNSGNLSFTITPVNTADDYDWAVYNLTNATCSDIYSNAALSVSCNFSSTSGTTGPTGGSALNSQGAGGTPFNATIPVTAGQTYVINVSNFSETSSGYTINLSNTTATIFDNVPPRLIVATPQTSCGGNQITLSISENILCSTIDNADFTITGPGGPYTVISVTSPNCSIGGLNTNTAVLTVSPSISAQGSYTVCLSGSSVTDLCGNVGVVGTTSCVPFTIALPPAPVTTPVSYCQNQVATPLTASSTATAPFNYSENFEGTFPTSGWTNINAGTGNSWAQGTSYACAGSSIQYSYNSTNAANAWMISPAQALVAGVTYTLSFDYKSWGSTISPEQLKITVGTANTVAAQTTILLDLTSISNTTCNTATVTFTPTVSGNYYFGFNCHSAANAWYLGVDNVRITANAPATLNWYTTATGGTSTTTAPTPSTTTIGTTTYWVSQTVNGCESVRVPITVTITSGAAPVFNPLPTTICSGATVPLLPTTSTNGISGTWSPSAISNTTSGTYTFTPSSAGACLTPLSYTITVYEPPVIYPHGINPSCSTICNGSATVDVVGGLAPYTYSWSNGGITQTISNLCAGTYDITVTDNHGCTSSAFSPVINNCIQIQSILVDACETNEGYGEMVFFQTGQNPINTSAMSVVWPSNSWQGITTNQTYINNVNSTITGGGILLPVPSNGILPANANVVVITGVTTSSTMSFSNLTDTLYVIFQNNTTVTGGHFGNESAAAGIRTLIMNFGVGCTDTVRYDNAFLINQNGTTGGNATLNNGASVNYSSNGTATYVNYDCAIPFTIQSDSVRLTAPPPVQPLFTPIGPICQGVTPVPAMFPNTSNNGYTGTWSPATINTAATTSYTFTHTVGTCVKDTTITVVVKLPTQSITLITRCNNQLPYNWNGTNYNAAGLYTYTTTNAAGCDSLAIVNLTVTNTTLSNSSATVCPSQLPYSWNGLTFIGAGTQTATLINAAGCDSLATLILSVSSTSSSTSNLSVCQNQLPYLWNGINYNAAGAYTYGPVSNSVNCDSIAILNLTIKQPTQSITPITRCNNQLPYNWNGTNYSAAGSYTYTTTNAAGCDSLAILNLAVTTTTQSITPITRCNNQLPYNWNGTNYNAAGSYTYTTTNAANCDSLAIVNLTVTTTTQSITPITRCNNQLPYNWNGTNYNAAGSYTYIATNAAGCDSLAIVNLTVTTTTQSITPITRCNNQLPYNWNGTNYNAAGSYTYITTNAAGCDSLAIVNLTVTTTTQSITPITRCNNQLPYNWNGTNYSAAGSYTYTTTNAAGCDSLAIVNLTVTTTTQSITPITRCNNQLPYNWNGTNYSAAGSYTYTTTNAAGCDSLAIVNLTVITTTQSITPITRCNNQLPYNWNGTNYSAAGSYTYTTTNAAGCDSLAIVNLTVITTTQSITPITRCNNQLPYNWNGTNYNAAGSYTYTTTNAAGCDSLAIVNLTVTTTTQSITPITRCNNQLPYNWNGTNYNAAGSYTYTTTNAAGCDSLAIVNLTVTTTTQSITPITRCNNQLPYNWNGTNYNAAGSYTYTTTNAANCDSLAIVNLTVTTTTQSITPITRCNNQLPYNWNGTNYSAAGSYTYTTTNAAGCDSLAIVNLTVTTTTQSITPITRCNNQLPYNWNGTNYSAAGSYTYTTTNAAGCDSLAIVNLTVTTTTQSITPITRCNNQLPYNWNGTNYNAAGSYTYTTTNAAGCDSLAIVNLTVTTTTQSITPITRCNNQLPYNWNGTNYSAAGSYTYTTTNAAGCDSLVIVNLTVTTTTQSITPITSCNNQLPYNWNGTNYSAAGSYTYTTINAAGCDSLAIVNLTVTTTTQSITPITRCNNQLPYNWNGTNYNAAGLYTYTTTNAAGCDSLAIVNLAVTTTTQSITPITRCNNQLPYNWNGTNYSAAGSYTYTTTNAAGCDSLAIVNLTVTNTTLSNSSATVCPSQLPYSWNGLTFSGAGTQTATLINAAGCDSLATLILSVSSTSSSTSNLSVCQNQLPYLWNGINYNTAGAYTYGPVPNSVNCDSIAILNLTIKQPTQSITPITRCNNQLPYNWNGTNYSAAGSYTYTTTNAAGCDSLAIVNLTVTTTTQSITPITRCNNQLPYNWNGTNYNVAGSYTYTTTNAAGCDSLAIVNLTVTTTTQSITPITRCNNQLPYNWNGTNYNAAGSYTFTTTNAAGCDSLAIVNLTVTTTTQSITPITRCNNQLPYNWNGTNYSAAGSYTYSTTNAAGCDSLAIVNLTVTTTTQSITPITRCNNQLPYNWNGTNYNAAGSYTYTTTNAAGCDSLAIVNLTVTNTTLSNSSATVCPSQLPYLWNGLTFSGAGTQTATLINAAGCDSLATLILSVSSTSSSTSNLSVCQNQLPYLWNGINYNAAGAYTYGPVPNSVNCDSIAILNLTIKQPTQSITPITRCNNQLPYNWNGTNYSAAGSYTYTTTNAAGCDSLAIVNLTVTNTTLSNSSATVCPSQLPYLWNGLTFSGAGTQTATLINAAGCDSMATLILSVSSTSSSTSNLSVCQNQLPYLWNGINYNAAGAYTYGPVPNSVNCDSIAILNLTIKQPTQSITPITRCNNQLPYNWNGTNYSAAGSYTYTTTNAAGCDSLAIVNLTVSNTTLSNSSVTVCPSQLPYSWNGLTFSGAGTQTATLINAAGCDSLATLILSVSSTSSSTSNLSVCQNQLPYLWNGINYNAAGAYTYGPVPNSVNCDSIAILNLTIKQPTQSITPITRCNNQLPYNWNGTNYNAAGLYTYTTTNAAGCDSLAIVNLTVTTTTQSITPITRCNNQLPYNWNGTNYSAAGSYTYTTTNAAGCDSLAIVNLTVTTTTQSITPITRCNNQLPYNWNGTNYNAAGSYTYTTTNAAGCDSLAIVNLIVTTTTQSITPITRCNNQLPYNWNGTNYSAAGSYTYTTTNADGCDSLAIVNLTVTTTTQSITPITRCNNQLPYNWNGTNYSAAGSYTYTTTNASGCDSLAIVNLTVTITTQSITPITRCNNQLPYNWNGTNYSAGGSYTYTTTNAAGCDSLAIVNLTVTTTTQSITPITRCNNQLPYNWNGTNYSAAGSYTYTTTNAAGCDSLAIVNLTVTNTTLSNSSATVCPSQLPYSWNGLTFSGAGTQMATLINAAGCDSLATLILSVSSTSSSTSNLSVCQNQLPYLWNGINYNAAGAYTFGPVPNSVNCDSIAILNLTIKQPTQSITPVTRCNNQLPYNWNGTNYSAAGSYTYTTTNAAGCDSLAIVNLAVTTTTQSITPITRCNNQLPYNWNGTNYNAAGSYTYTTTNAAGCDSLAILNLAVTTTTQSITPITRCNNQLPYNWNGTNYNAAGSYTYTTTNAAGCDSLAIVNLAVTTTTQSITPITRCNNQLPYNWNGTNYSAAGSYTYTTINAAGCDSLAIVNLIVNPIFTTNQTAAICQGQSYSLPWGGTVTTANTYSHTYTNSSGCDSVVNITLTINLGVPVATTITACESYTWNGTTYTSSGDYLYTYPSGSGCNTTDTLHLTITNGTHNAVTITNCESYVWNGTTYTASGDYLYNYTNALGCASVDTLHLTITNGTHNAVTITNCESYVWNGITYNASGDYTFAYTNASGCASVDTLYLTITTGTYNATTQTSCESYVWNGTTYNASGDYTFAYTNASGCASVDTLHLTITNGTHNAVTITNCESYVWNGTTYTTSGDYTFAYTNTSGCASVDTLHLTITTGTHNATTQTSCESYVWNGTTYTTSGDYLFNYTNTSGCASVDTLHLTITIGTYNATIQTSCESFAWNGTTYTSSGDYLYNYTNTSGCASVDTLHLTITNGTYTAITQSACGSFVWNGTTYTASGDYIYNYTNTSGCLSADTLHLTISNGVPVATTITSCESFTWNGTTYTSSGDYLYTYPSGSGCNTTDTLHLTITTSTYNATTQTSCESYVWNGTTYTTSGDYLFNYTNTSGCASVDTLHLTITTGTHNATTQTSCESYVWNGTTYTTSGDYLFNYTNTSGCASVDTLHLTITTGTHNATTQTSCESYVWNGTTYTTSGDYLFNYTNTSGCASVDTLHLTITNSTYPAITQSACGSFVWNGTTYTTSGDYIYNYTNASGCPAADTLHLTISNGVPVATTITACESYTWNGTTYTLSGDYLYTYPSGSGCNTTDTLHLTITTGTYNATTQTSCESYLWNGTTYTASGDYLYNYTNASGCASVDTLHLTITIGTYNATTQTSCESFVWNGTTYTTSGDYTFAYTNASGCASVDTLHLIITNGTYTAITQNACGSFVWNGTTYNSSGDYIYNYTNASGCASADTLHLTISNGVPVATTITACESYTWNGTTYTLSGDYLYTYPSGSGCNTTDTLHLTIANGTHNAVTITNCESYVWNGTNYNASGDYTFAYTNASGCASVDTLHLTITTGTHNATTQTSCESYVWNGTTYTTSGDYTFAYTNTSGCASVDTLHLTITNGTHNATTQTSCESYVWNGTTYTTSGDYTFAYTNTSGCASVDTLHLTITIGTYNATIQTSCESYVWNGTTYTTSGDYTFAYTNTSGCASVDTLHLTITNGTYTAITQSACGSFVWNGTTYTTSGDYTFAYTNASGCSSVDTLHLTITNGTYTAITQNACGSFVWNGTTYTASGDYIYNYTNASSCPSADTLHLTISNGVPVATTITACESYTWNGSTYTSSGDYLYTYPSGSGCNTTDTLHLTITTSTYNSTTQTSCESYVWNGTTYTTSGDYLYNYTNASGCASVDTLHLTITNGTYNATTQTSCESYVWNGTTYTTSGDYLYNYTNASGCASVDTLHLTITTGTYNATTQTSCESYIWNGTTYNASGDYTFAYTNAFGCASVDTLHLTITNGTYTAITQSACGSFVWNGTTYTVSGDYIYNYTNASGCASADTLHLTISNGVPVATTITACESYTWNGTTYTSSGDYLYTYPSGSGCNTTDTLHLTITTGTYNATTQTSCESYVWNGTTYTTSGDYTFAYTNASGCVSVDTLHLTITNGTHNTVTITNCESYVWNGATYTSSGDYLYNYTNASGCASVDTLHLTITNGTNTAITQSACGSFIWNGTTYTASGDYIYNYTNASGCASADTLHLTISNGVPVATTITACESYTWNGTTYTLSGDYLYTYPSGSGCNTTDTLHLTITNGTYNATTQTSCESYVWNGTTYTTSGDYLYNYTNVSGCVSVDTLHLTITTSTHNATNQTSCESYVWNGTTYTTSGDYTFAYTNSSGCASVDTLHLTITNGTNTAITQSACGSFIWNGTTYTASGDYIYNYTNASGCASADTLHLTISNGVPVATTITTCESYTWNGTTYTSSGDYLYNYPSGSGCNTTDTLHLTITTGTYNATTQTSCESYVWNGTTYTTSGDYTFAYTNTSGCASVDTLRLTITNGTYTAITQSACGSFVWNGTTYTASGDYIYNYTNASGCPSADTLHLTISNGVPVATTITACESFTWNGTTYTSSGDYLYTYPSGSGCNTTDTLHLTITTGTYTATTQTSCESYVWNGTTYTTSGDYTFAYTNTSGCASVDTLHLTITNGTHNAVTITNCESYVWNGTTYTTSGDYLFNYTNTSGCASVDTLHLTITTGTQNPTTQTSCESYVWNGTIYTTSGDYTFAYTNASGCASVDTLHLTITTGTHNASNQTSCESYVWNGTTYTTSGDYTFAYTNTSGCASVDTLHLTITTGTHNASNQTSCESYVWNGTTYTTSGDYLFNYTNTSGCASVDTLHLTITIGTYNATIQTSCESFVWHGTTYTSSGTYLYNYTNGIGCSSTDTLHLTINNGTHNAITQTSCELFVWNGTTYTTSGDYTYAYTNSSGCASVDTLHLTITMGTHNATTITACESYTWNGITYTTSGNFVFNYTNASGCASVDTLHLTITNGTHIVSMVTSCLNYSWNGTLYTASGTYYYNYTNSLGCASADTLHLTITNGTHQSISQSACNSFIWNGVTYNNSGNYIYNYTDINGCASADTLHLNIYLPTSSTSNITICSSELPYSWNGQSYSSGGTHVVILTNQNGCDSTATLQLTVNPTPAAPQVTPNLTICQYAASAPLSANGVYPLLWYTSPIGGTGSSVTPTPSSTVYGISHYYVSQINGNCESPRSEITIRVVRKPDLGNDKDLHVCFGESVNLNNYFSTGNMNATWTNNNTIITNTANITTPGNYQLVVANAFGCHDTAIVHLAVQPQITANAGPDDNAVYNEPYQLNGSGGTHYLWSPASYLNNSTIANPTAVLTDEMQFILTVSDDFGCTDKDTVVIKAFKGPTFYIPNAFTPNGDGINDNFKPTYVGIQKLEYFRVYDRYGVLVFETSSMGKAWDGFYKNTKQNTGNFVYVVKAIDKYGQEKVMKGNVVLIR